MVAERMDETAFTRWVAQLGVAGGVADQDGLVDAAHPSITAVHGKS
jgi:hypothetical protein